MCFLSKKTRMCRFNPKKNTCMRSKCHKQEQAILFVPAQNLWTNTKAQMMQSVIVLSCEAGWPYQIIDVYWLSGNPNSNFLATNSRTNVRRVFFFLGLRRVTRFQFYLRIRCRCLILGKIIKRHQIIHLNSNVIRSLA